MPRKPIESAEEEIDRELLCNIARQFGRALCLTGVAVIATTAVEDVAIAKMDEAWEELAHLIIDFARGEGD